MPFGWNIFIRSWLVQIFGKRVLILPNLAKESLFCQNWVPKLLFNKLMFPLFLRLPDRKFLESYISISMRQTKWKNVCLSVISEFSLSLVIVCNASTAYKQNLKYLLKNILFIQNCSNVARFLIFETLQLEQVKNSDLCLKKISQKWTAFLFHSTYFHQTFTESMFNQYAYFGVLMCQM